MYATYACMCYTYIYIYIMIIYFSLCVYAMWAYVYFFCWAYARECVCINKMCVSLLVQVTVWSTQLIINYGHIFTKKRKKGKKREKNKKESQFSINFTT